MEWCQKAPGIKAQCLFELSSVKLSDCSIVTDITFIWNVGNLSY